MTVPRHSTDRAAPIGVLDSGVGGLSVLQALQAALPHEDFVYIADSAHTPYGERGDEFVVGRTLDIAQHLRDACGVKALVIACNTASAAAGHAVRSSSPGWPVVAIEPALKPAAQLTRSGRVGVLATRGTLASRKYALLREAMSEAHPGTEFIALACDGLASAIERWALTDEGDPAHERLERYLAQLGPLGGSSGQIDTLVLGCTHYPLMREQIRRRIPPGIHLVEAGEPVARQARRLLHATGLLRESDDAASARNGRLRLFTTGDSAALQAATTRWLDTRLHVEPIALS